MENAPSLEMAATLRQMLFGQWVARAIYVAARLAIADRLFESPANAAALASACEADPHAIRRLLRTLGSIGIVEERADETFALTKLGHFLRSDVEGSMHALALMLGADWHWRIWEGVLESVRTGRPAFDLVHGKPFFEFLRENETEARLFDRSMTSFSSVENAAIASAYDFGPFHTVVDVGGGRGHLLRHLLERNPHLAGVLYDRPHVIEAAAEGLSRSNVAYRVRWVGGDFLASVPEGGDLYVIKHVLHNWSDAKMVTILRNCRKVIPSHGRLLVAETVLPAGNAPHPGKLMDFEMLVLLEGAQERSEAELARRFAEAGFELTGIFGAPGAPITVVEGAPV